MNDFKKDILQKIKTGEVDMRPRWHFMLRSSLWILGTVIVGLVALYFISFVLFALRASGVGFIPLYGLRGLLEFVTSSPWVLILASGTFLVLLEVLVSRYAFTYKRPLLYSMIGFVAVALIGSFFIDRFLLHERLSEYTQQRNVPVLTELYKKAGADRPDTVLVGTVEMVTETGLVVVSDQGQRLEIIITEHTKQRSDTEYGVGSEVLVFGENRDGKIEAVGVRLKPRGIRSFAPAPAPDRPLPTERELINGPAPRR